MILCDAEIKAAIKNRQLKVTPTPPDDQFETSALDLTLGDEFKEWKLPEGKSVHVEVDLSGASPFGEAASDYLKDVKLTEDGSVLLRPGGFLLAKTAEYIELPKNSRLAARVEGRSSLARLGLAVHLTAPTIHAGFQGTIALEITNQGPIPIRLRPGQTICQLVLEQVFGTPAQEMTGLFQGQKSVTGNLKSGFSES
jgi:dCTP deaminase